MYYDYLTGTHVLLLFDRYACITTIWQVHMCYDYLTGTHVLLLFDPNFINTCIVCDNAL